MSNPMTIYMVNVTYSLFFLHNSDHAHTDPQCGPSGTKHGRNALNTPVVFQGTHLTCLLYIDHIEPTPVQVLYGFLSDAYPFLGYRRKTYLMLGNAIAVSQSQHIVTHLPTHNHLCLSPDDLHTVALRCRWWCWWS